MKFPHLFTGIFSLLILAGCKDSTRPAAGSASSSAASATAADAGRPDEPATLKLNWPVGGRFNHRMELEQKMDLPFPSAAQPTKQEVTMGQDFALNVLRERPGGGHEVELEFQAVNMSVSMGGNEVLGFDTRGEATGDEQNPAVRPLRLMVGQKLVFHLDASNAVERVDGVEKFLAKIGAGAGTGPGRNPMADMFNEEYFKQIMDFGRDFPPGAVPPGTTWPSSREVVMGPLGRATLSLTNTFKGWELRDRRRCALLEFTGSITGKPAGTNGPFAGMMSVTGGRTSGQSWFDPARGHLIDNTAHMTMRVKMNFPGRPGAPAPAGAAPSETTMEQRYSIKLVEDAAK